MNQYAVLGNPIAHSQSPFIHQFFAKQTQQQLEYRAILVELDGLARFLNEFQARGGKGVNITLPFKQEAFALVDVCSDLACEAEAVNTIKFEADGRRFGANTDGIGLVRDIVSNKQIQLKEKTILVLGAGGAVKGVLGPLLREQPKQLILANRTVSKALAVAEHFATTFPILACGLHELMDFKVDIVINGTSAGLHNEELDLPTDILNPGAFCYDMVYGKTQTSFQRWAMQAGAQYADGFGMLVEQAAESLFLWTNNKPKTDLLLSNSLM